MRPTRQRLAVLRVVDGLDVFADAQAIHERLVSMGERVSLSTVYRSLAALADGGAVAVMRSHDGTMLFHRCPGRQSRHHLVCRSCGRALELPEEPVRHLIQQWAHAADFDSLELVLDVSGVCGECRPDCENDPH